MAARPTSNKAVLTALCAQATVGPDALRVLVDTHLRRFRRGASRVALAQALLDRPDPPADLLVRAARAHCTDQADVEAFIAGAPRLPAAAQLALACSQRIRTLRTLLGRADLDPAAVARLARHRNATIAAAACAHPNLTTAGRLALAAGTTPAAASLPLQDWCRTDPTFANTYLRAVAVVGGLVALAGSPWRYDRAGLVDVAPATVDDDLVDLLAGAVAANLVDEHAAARVSRWLRRTAPTGAAVAAVLDTVARLMAGGRLRAPHPLVATLVAVYTVPVFALDGVGGGCPTPRRWADDASVAAAAAVPGQLAAAAYASAALPAPLVDAAWTAGEHLESLVLNPALGVARAVEAVDRLPPERWWALVPALGDAAVPDGLRVRLASSCPAVNTVAAAGAAAGQRWAEPWLARSVVDAVLAAGGDAVAGANLPVWAAAVLARHDDLADAVVGLVTPATPVDEPLADAVAARAAAVIGASAAVAETFVELLDTWDGPLTGLAGAAAQLSGGTTVGGPDRP